MHSFTSNESLYMIDIILPCNTVLEDMCSIVLRHPTDLDARGIEESHCPCAHVFQRSQLIEVTVNKSA